MKRTNSISSLPHPSSSSSSSDDDKNKNIHQYSLLSADIDNDENDHDVDDDDDDTMSLSSFHQHGLTFNGTTGSAASTTTTNIKRAPPTMTKFTPSFATNHHNYSNNINDITSTLSSNLDDLLTQLEVWVQQQNNLRVSQENVIFPGVTGTNYHLQKPQQLQQLQLQLQTYLHEILVLSKKYRISKNDSKTSSDGVTPPVDTSPTDNWTVPRVLRFVTGIILPLLQNNVEDLQLVRSSNDAESLQKDDTAAPSALAEYTIRLIYTTLDQLMEQHSQIWNTYLIYVATTTTATSITADNYSNTIIEDRHIGSNDSTGFTIFSAVKQTFQYIVSMHRNHSKTTKSDGFEELSQSIFVLYTSIWYTYQSIHDHYTIQNTSCMTASCSWHDVHLDADDTSTLLQIAWRDIISESPITTATSKLQRHDDNFTSHCCDSKTYILSCCSYILIQLSKQTSRHEDCIAMLFLKNENDRLQSMSHYVRNFIQDHHLHNHHHEQSAAHIQPRHTDIDSHIALRYIDVLVGIYAKRNNDDSRCTHGNDRKFLDEIRQLILVDHTFLRYLIETMILPGINLATTFSDKHESVGRPFANVDDKMHRLRQQELSLSIIKTLYDVVPDTIDAILSSELPVSNSISITTALESHNKGDTTNEQMVHGPHNLIHSFLCHTLHTLVTNPLIDQHALNHHLHCILFFHSVQRTIVRQCMMSYFDHEVENSLTSMDGPSMISKLLQHLLYFIEVSHSFPAASFLEQLLTDATDTLPYDGLSRRIWSVVSNTSSTSAEHQQQSSVFKHIMWKAIATVLIHHERNEKICSSTHVPYPLILIKLVDMAYFVVRNIDYTKSLQSQTSYHDPNVKSAITPGLIKSLLHALTPGNQLASLESIELLVSDEENTPTVQNLSRCDIAMHHDETGVIQNEAPAHVLEADTSI